MKKEYDFRRAKRANFQGLPPLAELDRRTKVRITIMIDADVLQCFKERAARPRAEPYQTQINRALRESVSGVTPGPKEDLLKDESFISRLAERVAEYALKEPVRTQRTRKAPVRSAP